MPEDLLKLLETSLPTVIVAIITGLAAWLVARTNKRGDHEKMLFDQMQEDMTRLRQDVLDVKAENSKLRSQINAQRIHFQKLEKHIMDGNPPPPPILVYDKDWIA